MLHSATAPPAANDHLGRVHTCLSCCCLSFIYYPATCGPKGHGSGAPFLSLQTKSRPQLHEPYRGSLIFFPQSHQQKKKTKRQRKNAFCLSRPASSSPVQAQTPLDLHPLHPSPGPPKPHSRAPRSPISLLLFRQPHSGRMSPLVPTRVVWVGRGVVGPPTSRLHVMYRLRCLRSIDQSLVVPPWCGWGCCHCRKIDLMSCSAFSDAEPHF